MGGIPILLVIVMKGRLGDTFPSSFSTLDMRATKHRMSGVALSTLVQELGRLCFHSSDASPRFRTALVSSSLFSQLRRQTERTAISDSVWIRSQAAKI